MFVVRTFGFPHAPIAFVVSKLKQTSEKESSKVEHLSHALHIA